MLTQEIFAAWQDVALMSDTYYESYSIAILMLLKLNLHYNIKVAISCVRKRERGYQPVSLLLSASLYLSVSRQSGSNDRLLVATWRW